MRMYLSSFQLGDHPEHLLALVDRPGAVAVIVNALDAADVDRRRAAVQQEIEALAGLGLDAVEVDLREHADDAAGLTRRLLDHSALWVRGGNVFVLRKAMAVSGADLAITDLVRADRLVYAGYSAGPCVAGPHLRGLEEVDDESEVERAYGGEPVWEGLGLLDRLFVPHVDSPGHPETEDCTRIAERLRREGVERWALRDGQALVVDGDAVRVV
jgi:dipeptidase E